jgi:hypothetical protein
MERKDLSGVRFGGGRTRVFEGEEALGASRLYLLGFVGSTESVGHLWTDLPSKNYNDGISLFFLKKIMQGFFKHGIAYLVAKKSNVSGRGQIALFSFCSVPRLVD